MIISCNSGIPPDFDGLIKMKLWLTKLHQMKASDELEEDEARFVCYDLPLFVHIIYVFIPLFFVTYEVSLNYL